MKAINPTKTKAWQALQRHYQIMKKVRLQELFAIDPNRSQCFSYHLAGELRIDCSKNILTTKTLQKLIRLAEETQLAAAIQALVNGEKINKTEGRASLHMALRNRSNRPMRIDGFDVMPQVNAVLAKMKRFCDQVLTGEWRGYSGLAITDVVSIGIGGSHLGPSMAVQALSSYRNHLRCHFIANVDGGEITDILSGLDPASTLVIISSKSFSTPETLINAQTVRQWLLAAVGDSNHLRNHLVAVSANAEAVADFGIGQEQYFEIWDWVGGRFSLWSAIGLPVALAIGFEQFEQLLSGSHVMDQHFINTHFDSNLPVILALLSIWYTNFFGAETEAIFPYDYRLQRLVSYLQQANMESNGKSVDRQGNSIDYATAPIIWGEPGTNGQHAFFQLIHQGTHLVPCDFIAIAKPHHPLKEHHEQLLANCFAQTQALAFGKEASLARREIAGDTNTTEGMNFADFQRLLPFQQFSGNKPSNTLLLKQLTPYTLGLILSLYEHKIFVQGSILNIFSFDQWGVELGKQLAQRLLPRLRTSASDHGLDSSTEGLISNYLSWHD